MGVDVSVCDLRVSIMRAMGNVNEMLTVVFIGECIFIREFAPSRTSDLHFL